MAFTSEIYLYLYDSILVRGRLFILIKTGEPIYKPNYIVFAKTTSKITNIIMDISVMIKENIEYRNDEFVVGKTTYTVCKSNISLVKYFKEYQRQILKEQQYILDINEYLDSMNRDDDKYDSFTIKNILTFSNSIENIYQKYLFTLIPENIKKLKLTVDQLSEEIKTVLKKHDQKKKDYKTKLNKIKTQINKLMLNIKLKILYKIINKYKKTLEIHHLNPFEILNNINTYIQSDGDNKIKERLNELLNGTLDVSKIKDKEELIKCIMLFGIAAEYNMNDSCKNKQIYKVYELRF